MLIHLIRNRPQGNAITGRLVIDGRWFCNTLERVGYQIPALCYHVCVTMSPKFKRLLPLVQNVPALLPNSPIASLPMRSGIRFHRGSKPEHSTGCVLVVGDNNNDNSDNLRPNQYPLGARDEMIIQQPKLLDSTTYSAQNNTLRGRGIGRSAAEIEREITSLILKAQQEHEAIILEVTDFRPGTEYGYNHPCEPELQEHKRDARRAEQRYLDALEAGLL